MKYLETKEEKIIYNHINSFVIMFILFFYLGLTLFDPPPENGIAINFGTTEFGSGEIQPTEAIQSAQNQQQLKLQLQLMTTSFLKIPKMPFMKKAKNRSRQRK
jgi:hypothetical protein